jgi:prepilin-type processing-associated H-X9-DG protein
MGRYQYRYTVSWNMCDGHPGNPQLAPTVPFRATQVRHPSEKILLIDEDGQTIDDGCWAPQQAVLNNANVLSIRHDRQSESTTNPNAGRGNALFCDAHAEFILRANVLLPTYFDPTAP